MTCGWRILCFQDLMSINLICGVSDGVVSSCPRDFRERPRVGVDGFGDGLAIDELPFAAAGDQPSFAQNFEMERRLGVSRPASRRSRRSSSGHLPTPTLAGHSCPVAMVA
jgi:hypothetical protein